MSLIESIKTLSESYSGFTSLENLKTDKTWPRNPGQVFCH